MKIKYLGIALKPSRDDKFNAMVNHLLTWLYKRQIEILLPEEDEEQLSQVISKKFLKNIKFCSIRKMEKADALLSLGGDGTLIGLCRKIRSNIPIIGVNWGKLGFITEYSAEEMFDALESIIKGDYQISKRKLFKVEISDKDKVIFKSRFVNDVVLSNSRIARMFSMNVEYGEDMIFNLSGDGLIISTPMGSTAYSLAAGGPIVHHDVQSMLITPICPHGLTHRPMVIPATSVIKASVKDKEEDVVVTVDGQISHALSPGYTVVVKVESKQSLSFVRNSNKSYYHTLKQKLMLNRRSI